MTETYGADFAWTKPSPQALLDAGNSFVLGYISDDASKDLQNPMDYVNAGLRVGLVFETYTNRAAEGYGSGKADGQHSEQAANARGYPVDAPLFFAVDYDAQPGDFGAIQDYANGFNEATRRPVGIYGSFTVVEHFVTLGQAPIQFGWQAAAWSGGNLSSKAHLYQRIGQTHTPIGGVPSSAYDENVLCIDLPLAGKIAAPPQPNGIGGAIAVKYNGTPGLAGILGAPITPELACPDGIGRFNHFVNDASIYWTPNSNAYSVHGAIRDAWAAQGWETSPLGYPTSDEFTVNSFDFNGNPNAWQQSNFQHGCLCFDPIYGIVERH